MFVDVKNGKITSEALKLITTMSKILKILMGLTVVALGATVFNVLVMPYMTASLYIQKKSSIEKTVLDNVKKSIIVMQTPFGMRSGLVLTEDGFVVALNSMLNQKNVISGYIAGDHVSLKNLHMANDNLALFKISKNGLSNIKFADQAKIIAGQNVFLVAAASFEQDNWIVGEGAINQITSESIVTDIVGSPEVSSGSLFNMSGEFIGVVYLDQSGITVAIPPNKIRELIGLL